MSAETILQAVLLEVGQDAASAQISSSDYAVRQVVQFMNAAGADIATRAEWSRLYRDLTASGSQSSVDLPQDFYEMAEQGAVTILSAPTVPARAVIAPEQWGFLENRPSTQPYYHLSGGQIRFAPALPAEGARIRYVSRNWVSGGKSRITENGDDLLIPERLVEKGAIWRWKRQKGLPFDDVLAEFEADLLTEIRADRGQA